jgi:hypothetical protein
MPRLLSDGIEGQPGGITAILPLGTVYADSCIYAGPALETSTIRKWTYSSIVVQSGKIRKKPGFRGFFKKNAKKFEVFRYEIGCMRTITLGASIAYSRMERVFGYQN